MNPPRTNRRELLGWSAALAASAAWVRLPHTRPDADDVEELVRWVMSTPRDPALQRAARELRAGLDPARLLGAILVASARDIRTDLPGFNHAALSVSAIDQLTRSAPPAERGRDTLWCLDYFKEAQESEARSGDWLMPPLETSKLPGGAKARAALVDALERWDREAADVAVAGWIRSAPLEEVYALISEYGLRCAANIGHKGIYAALSRRALQLAGERFAEDVLRSVVASFFLHGRTRKAAPFEHSREIVAGGIVVRAPRPVSDLGPARELLGAVRQVTPEELPAVVAQLLREGAAAATLWDAVVAAASEVTVANPTTGPLHASTSTNSLHYIALHAPSVRVEQIALLQAAAWVAEFRAALPAEAARMRIDAVEASPSTMDAILVDAPRGMPTARGALWLGRHDLDGFRERALGLARSRSDDVHEFKLAAAALEEARLAGSWVQPFVCAALAMHLPAPGRADGVRLQRIGDAMAVASAR